MNTYNLLEAVYGASVGVLESCSSLDAKGPTLAPNPLINWLMTLAGRTASTKTSDASQENPAGRI